MGAISNVVVDVLALPSATEVCVSTHCVPVSNGLATLKDPLIGIGTWRVTLTVRTADGSALARARDLRLPRSYPNGFGCDGDAPQGTVTFNSVGAASVSKDTGFGQTTR